MIEETKEKLLKEIEDLKKEYHYKANDYWGWVEELERLQDKLKEQRRKEE